MKRNRIFQKGTLAAAGGLLLCAAAAAGCASHRGDASSEPAVSAGSPSVPPGGTIAGGSPQVASPPVIIYKTRKDYSHNVPVIMDASRRRIVSYPAPSDLRRGKELALPTLLEGGFWLDNRGINEHVAFLTYTYEEYSRLPKAPSMDELMAHLLDKQPLVDFRVCGRRADYDDIVSELNALIRRNGW